MPGGAASPSVSFSRDDDVWVGTFAGLGSVRVSPGGGIEIEVDQVAADEIDPEDSGGDERARRLEALRWGWAEPLAWARRGCEVVIGSALVAPDGGPALVLTGQVHEVPVVVCGLAQRGWSVLADRFVPIRWIGTAAEVQPTATPFLIARRRAREMELQWADVRADSDAVAVELQRSDVPAPVGGVLSVLGNRVGLSMFELLVGHQRFEVASIVGAGGVLRPDVDPPTPAEAMARDVSLAALPIAQLHLDADDLDTALDAITTWWAANGEGGSDAANQLGVAAAGRDDGSSS